MDIQKILKELSKKLPKFPDGRIDYTTSNRCVVLNCFVEYDDKVLLLKRSDKVLNYKGMWNSIAGFIDQFRPVKEKLLEELSEELDIHEDDIKEIFEGKVFESYDDKIDKTWIICPYLVTLNKKKEIKLDWEHTDYAWIEPRDINNYKTVPGLDNTLNRIISESRS